MDVHIDANTIITASAVLTAIVSIGAMFLKGYKWYLKQNEQDVEIKRLKEENTLLCYGLSACLDGLMQLGCNHSVPEAKEKLDKYLNKQAHQ